MIRNAVYIIVCLSLLSCVSHKNLGTGIVHDETAEKYQRALLNSKNQLLQLDSANTIIQDLGWARRIIKEAKISENTIPPVFKCINDDSFTIELPCWEFDSPEYQTANVIVEHRRIDSAIVLAKIKGIDEIYSRSQVQVVSQLNERDEYLEDIVKYSDTYEYYVRNAYLTCLCISKRKKIFIVNATVQIHNKYNASEAETHRFDE